MGVKTLVRARNGGISRASAAMIALILLFDGCAKHRKTAHVPQTPTPQKKQRQAQTSIALGYTEEGVASWYGYPFNGRHAADGEIYDMEQMVAAHKLMPFNTWMRVTNLDNGKTTQVRIIDRGPFVGGRIIDLSHAAARAIDMIGPGTAHVRLEVIAAPVDIPSEDFYAVQVGAFTVQANAEHARDELAQRYGNAQVMVREGNPTVWRVVVGKEKTVADAEQLAITLRPSNPNVFVVRLDPATASGKPIPPPPVPLVKGPDAVTPNP